MKVQVKNNQLSGSYELKDGFYELEKWKRKRTNPQNAYLHAIPFMMIAKAMTKKYGHKTGKISMLMAKELMKRKFLDRWSEILQASYVMKTSKLSTIEFNQFVEKLQQYGAMDLNIDIPSPNETDYNKIEGNK